MKDQSPTTTAIEKIVAPFSGVAFPTKEKLEELFQPFRKTAEKWRKQAETITVTNEDQTEMMAKAREVRLALRKIRLEVTDTHKELKEGSLRYSQTIDAIKRELVGLIEPIEEKLERDEKFKEVQEQKRKEAVTMERAKLLSEFMPLSEAMQMPLATMKPEAFDTLLKGYRLAKQAEQEQKRANEEAAAAEKARLKELQEKENERKRKEEEEAAARRKAARAPDVDKVKALIETYKGISFPKLKSEEAQVIIRDAQILNGKIVDHLTRKLKSLE